MKVNETDFFKVFAVMVGLSVIREVYLYLSILLLVTAYSLPKQCYAIASDDDTLMPYIATDMLYDSNLLRVADDVGTNLLGGKAEKSDIINQLMAGFDMDWKVSNQHIIIKANVNQNWHQNFTSLDYTGWNTQTQWNWQLGNDFNGEIGYANIETLGNFSYLNSLESNLQNNQRYFANGGWLFHPSGKVKIGVYRNQMEFDSESRQFNNNTEDTGEFNLLYVSPKGSSIGFQLLATDGQFPDLVLTGRDSLDNAYTRFNYGATWDWHISKKTQFGGFLGYTEQNYDNISARNFDGFIGRLNLHWQPREKIQFDVALLREINQAQNLLTTFLLTQGVESLFTWQPSSKIKLKLIAAYQNQQNLGDVNLSSVGKEREQDDVGNIGLNLSYYPVSNISITTVLNFEKRNSNNLSRSYESQSAGFNLKASF